MNTSRTGVVALLAVLVLVGCGDADQETSADTADTSQIADQDAEQLPVTADSASRVQHFDSDFAQVCQGTEADWATPYDPTVSGPHKVVVFQGPDEGDLTSIATGNTEWDVLFDETTDAYADVELVACAIRTGEELAQTCAGYADDGVETGNTVDYYSATYDVTLREATTAKVLGETTVEAPADTCPMLVFFDEGETTKDEYASVDVNDFLLGFANT